MGRSPSTICRELARNRDPRTGGYQPERAHTMAWQRQRRPKVSKIGCNSMLRAVVQQMLGQRLSPDQIAGRLRLLHPDNDRMQVSHESIYRSIYIYPRGEMARELKATLRSGRTVRRPRGRRKNGSRIVGAVSITERPEEVEGRLVPGHHERIFDDQRAARFPPTGRGGASSEGGGWEIPSARISRATSSRPAKRQAIAPRQASAMKLQADPPEPLRAAVPKSMAA